MRSESNPPVEQYPVLGVTGVDVQSELYGTWTDAPLRWTDAVDLADHLNFVRQHASQANSVPRARRQVWERQNNGEMPLPGETRLSDNISDNINRLESDSPTLLDLNRRTDPPTAPPAHSACIRITARCRYLTALENKIATTADHDCGSRISDERGPRDIQGHAPTDSKCASCLTFVGPPHLRKRGVLELQLEVLCRWHGSVFASEYLRPRASVLVPSD